MLLCGLLTPEESVPLICIYPFRNTLYNSEIWKKKSGIAAVIHTYFHTNIIIIIYFFIMNATVVFYAFTTKAFEIWQEVSRTSANFLHPR